MSVIRLYLKSWINNREEPISKSSYIKDPLSQSTITNSSQIETENKNMSSKVKNSFSTFLDQAVILTNNSMEILDKINEAVTSNEDSVTLTITSPENPESSITYQIPSFGSLKNSIDRLEATLATMSNVEQPEVLFVCLTVRIVKL